MPKWIEVESSWINAVNYFAEESALEVNLLDGKTYVYFDVPETVYKEMLTAKSKGEFYNERIKGQFNSVRLAPD